MSHFRGLSLQNITLITEITFQVLAMDGKTFLLRSWSKKKGSARIHLMYRDYHAIHNLASCNLMHTYYFFVLSMQYFKYTSQNSGVHTSFTLFSQSKLEHLWESIFLQAAFSILSTHVLNGIIHAEKYGAILEIR